MLKSVIKKLQSKYKYNWKQIEVRFIVSSGRTGTWFFADFFSEPNFKNIYSVHQPEPDMFHIAVDDKIRANKTKYFLVDRILYTRAPTCKYLVDSGTHCYVESNPYISTLIPELRATFPKVKFLYLVRDPKSYVVSSYNYSPPNGNGKLKMYDLDDQRDHLRANDFADDPYANKWGEMSRFEKICWNWAKYNEVILQDTTGRNDTLMLRFEDIFKSKAPEHALTTLIDFFGFQNYMNKDIQQLVEVLNQKRNPSGHRDLGPYNTWSQEQVEQFQKITSATAQKLNYEI